MRIRTGVRGLCTRPVLVVAVAPTAMLALTIAASYVLKDRLPDPIAVHFDDGRPDEASSLWPVIRDIIVIDIQACSLLALLAFLRPPGSMGQRLLAGSVVALTTLISVSVLLGPVGANLNMPDWRSAKPLPGMEGITIGAGVVAFVLAAIAVYPLGRRSGQPAELPPEPIPSRIGARRGHTAWIGQSRNPEFVRKTLAATCVMAVLALLGTYWMAVPALASLATLHLWGGILVAFDGRTLSVRGRVPFGVILRIPVRRIETAEVIDVDPRDWGGWGWRMRSLKRHALVVRGGEALLVALRGGGELIVTVDDAATGAEEIRRALRGDPRSLLHRRHLPAPQQLKAHDTGCPPAV